MSDETAEAPPSVEHAPTPQRAVTVRSIVLGLTGVVAIAAYSDFNDGVVKAGPPLAGNQLPIVPMALVLLVAVAWNPLAGRLWRGLRLSGRELAVALMVMLVSVWLPGYGIYRSFAVQLVRPWTHLPSHPEWEREQVVERLPAHLFPLAHDEKDPRYEVVYRQYENGLTAYEGKHLPIRAAPWREWLPVMVYWGPLLLLVAVVLGALAVLVHRQWSKHEQLPYPLASVYAALIPGEGGGLPAVMRTRLFWFGVAPPVIFFGNNWLCGMTHHFPWIPFGFWFNGDIQQVFPVLGKVEYNGCGWIHFSGMGLAYFVASEVGLSVGVGYMFYGLCAAQWYMVTGDVMSGTDRKDTTAGAYIGYAAVLIATGRTYYWSALSRAFRPLKAGEETVGPWAARVLLLASAAMVWLLSSCFGFDWFIACIYVAAFQLFFLVVTRVICETGIPFLQAEMDIGMVLASTLGFPAIGPGSLVAMYWLGSILNFDTRVCFMPFAANALRLAEHTGVRLRSVVPVALLAIGLAVVIGFAGQIYVSYSVGAKRDQYHVLLGVTDSTFRDATEGLTILDETGRLARSEATHGLAKLGLLADNNGHGRRLGWMAFGIIGVVALFLARFRWTGFPLHPIVFIVWATWPAQVLWFPFLVGWAAKTAIVRFGGGKAYHAGKPFFLGLIIGEVMVAAFFIVANLCYYLATGLSPGSGYFGG